MLNIVFGADVPIVTHTDGVYTIELHDSCPDAVFAHELGHVVLEHKHEQLMHPRLVLACETDAWEWVKSTLPTLYDEHLRNLSLRVYELMLELYEAQVAAAEYIGISIYECYEEVSL